MITTQLYLFFYFFCSCIFQPDVIQSSNESRNVRTERKSGKGRVKRRKYKEIKTEREIKICSKDRRKKYGEIFFKAVTDVKLKLEL